MVKSLKFTHVSAKEEASMRRGGRNTGKGRFREVVRKEGPNAQDT